MSAMIAVLAFLAGVAMARWYYKAEIRSLENTLQIKLNADHMLWQEAPDAR